ncbi:MAG: hypothetical protein ACLFTK_03645 [Anaerolineales bacterium]
MKNLSWNLRIAIGGVVLIILSVGGFFAWYSVSQGAYDGPAEYTPYPNVEPIAAEETEGRTFYRFIAPDDHQAVQAFFAEQGFECQAFNGNVQEGPTIRQNVFVRATCLLERIHPLGFQQTVQVSIQPERTALEYENNNPQGAIVGGGIPTGRTFITEQSTWDTSGLFGG